MKLKRYKKPVVAKVELDPKQAVIAVCSDDSGIWMAGPWCLSTRGSQTTGSSQACLAGGAIRGSYGTTKAYTFDTDSEPS